MGGWPGDALSAGGDDTHTTRKAVKMRAFRLRPTTTTTDPSLFTLAYNAVERITETSPHTKTTAVIPMSAFIVKSYH